MYSTQTVRYSKTKYLINLMVWFFLENLVHSRYIILGIFFYILLDTHCTLYRKLSSSILNCSCYKMNRKRNVKEMNQDKTPISFIRNGLIYLLFFHAFIIDGTIYHYYYATWKALVQQQQKKIFTSSDLAQP